MRAPDVSSGGGTSDATRSRVLELGMRSRTALRHLPLLALPLLVGCELLVDSRRHDFSDAAGGASGSGSSVADGATTASGGGSGGAGGSMNANPTRRILVTNATTRGHFQAIQPTAAAICQGVGSSLGSSFRPWIAGGGYAATCTPETTYVLVDGTVVGDCNDFANGTLHHAIDMTESGTHRVSKVWTGAHSNGSATGNDCGGWMSAAFNYNATYGWSNSTNKAWTDTNATDTSCADLLPIYCMED